MKVFRPGDFAPMLPADPPPSRISPKSRASMRCGNRQLVDQANTKGFTAAKDGKVIRQTSDFLASTGSVAAPDVARGGRTSAQDEVVFGAVGNPLTRGDWQRFGNTANRDWSTVTGLVVCAHLFQSVGANLTLEGPVFFDLSD